MFIYKMLRVFIGVALLTTLALASPEKSEDLTVLNTNEFEISRDTVLVSTIDGHLRALDTSNGDIRWTLQEEPVLRAPNAVKQGFTFLPNPQDGSLYVLKDGSLKKLPFNIPQLVSASPCKGTDGILYAGSKKDVWFGIDPNTGVKVETLSSSSADRICPASQQNTVFVGRSEYRISMFDEHNRGKTWNATFSDYSAHLLPESNRYKLRHYVSSSTGNILTVRADTGDILWERDLRYPIVALYLLQQDGLHKLPFTVIGKETMENLIKSAYTMEQWQSVLSAAPSSTPLASTLYSTLYVGESPYGLYAMNTLVDKHTITYSPKLLGPPLLEGPSPIALTTEERKKYVPPRRPIVSAESIPSITHKTLEGEFLVLGYHESPPMAVSPIFPARFPSFQYPPSLVWKPSDAENQKQLPAQIGGPTVYPREEPSLSSMLYHIYLLYPVHFYSVIISLLLLLATTIWLCGRQSATASLTQPPSAQTSRHSSSGRQWAFTRTDLVPEGWMNVGKLQYNPAEVLGRGCEGTVVYRGKFDGREVAVKRVVSEFVRFVDREADLLRESDANPHVIRYFCMEADSQFRYLALELCIATLNDYVEVERVREKVQISETELLRQATEGLAHLHSIQIVHRDMKPQNVLISTANAKGHVRAVISDFGLCKRIQPGRHSLSRGLASGLAGTDGWIAPEALVSESTSYPVDIFSLGCIFYFVLTKGKHPFGSPISRQTNIVSGEYNLQDISENEDAPIIESLIKQMIEAEPKQRPPASSILLHPFFWDAKKRLHFFMDASNRVEKDEDNSAVVRRLERNGRTVVRNGWREHICDHLKEDLRKFRTYKNHSVRDLLRAMRNKRMHYRELPKEVRESLGYEADDFLRYFISRFPALLLHVYTAMEWCSIEPEFKMYYPDEVRERIKDEVAKDELERKEKEDNMTSQQWVRGQVTSSPALQRKTVSQATPPREATPPIICNPAVQKSPEPKGKKTNGKNREDT